jgi:hypothetical protein
MNRKEVRMNSRIERAKVRWILGNPNVSSDTRARIVLGAISLELQKEPLLAKARKQKFNRYLNSLMEEINERRANDVLEHNQRKAQGETKEACKGAWSDSGDSTKEHCQVSAG